jgi:cellulose synthase/poly-beta-1,6-N-acetylglucosamine synthase-like glycosyltransferase
LGVLLKKEYSIFMKQTKRGMFIKPLHSTNPTCTAIVCAHNEAGQPPAVLQGLLEAPFVQEIIVVDDGSKDRTPYILHQYEQIAKIHPIFLSSNHGKGYAKAEVTAAASGDILLFHPGRHGKKGFQEEVKHERL